MNLALEPRACRMLLWALLLVFQICGGPLWGFSVGARDVSGRALPFFPELKSTLPGQTGTPTFGYSYRPDGGMTAITENLSGTVRSYTYAYGDQGLLVDSASAKARTSPWRTVSIPSRDGRGRISAASTTLAGQSNPVFNEAWTFAGWKDSKITGYVRATAGAEPENWSYGYDAETPEDLVSGRSRLTRETPPANLAPTQRFAFDFGKSGGLGVRTEAATGLNQTPAFKHVVAEDGGLNAFARTEKESVNGISWTNGFDARGNVVSRTGSDGSIQQLSWDALGRLISVTTPGVSESHAYYDGFNRRIRTDSLSNGVTQTLDSVFDPHIEFLELAVTASQGGTSQRVWKVYGPDVSGVYGGAQGVGGLEALVDEASGTSIGVVTDLFGNVAGTVGGDLSFKSSLRVGAYGPMPGQTPVEAGNLLQSLATATVWQSRRLDPTGFYWMGARYYDPQSGRLLSPDPLGHDASLSLYDYANGDPVNGLDPDGRCVKGLFGGAIKGDYYKPENTAQAVGQFLGQVGVGFTPAGIFADIRDLSAAYGDIQKDGLSWGSGTNLALGAVAVIPGVGDVVKGAGKAILRTFTKNAQEIRAIDRAAVLSDAPTVNLREFGNAAEATPNPYAGIQDASAYLRAQGVSRADRVQILQSFNPQNMTVRQAGSSEFGLRFFSDACRPGGSYLFETFPASRSSLAIKPEWSTMSGFKQFQVRPRATILEGTAAPQGPYLPGGQTQKFIPDWRNNLLEP